MMFIFCKVLIGNSNSKPLPSNACNSIIRLYVKLSFTSLTNFIGSNSTSLTSSDLGIGSAGKFNVKNILRLL